MDGRALVLGGGGVTGIAWETGLIAGLAELGIDLAAADVIIGTSAGSVVGADITCGQEPDALYQAQLAPPDPEPAARIGWGVIGRLLWVMNTSRDPVRARARIGRWALAARIMPEAGRRKVFQARLPAGEWPAKMLKVTAVDARTGELVVFDSAGEAGLVDAVGASCAVPGIWPPVTIGNRRFVDGGVRSVANADLAARYERVVIVAPVAQGTGPLMPSPGRQAAALAAAGARVALVRPDRAAMRAIGRNVLDVSRRAAAATAGRAQATAEAAAVRTVWQAGDEPAVLLAVRPGAGSTGPAAQASTRRAPASASGPPGRLVTWRRSRGVGDRWPASWWSARSVPGGRCRPLCRRSGDTVLISREHPAETARGNGKADAAVAVRGPKAPVVRAIGPCLRPLAGAMVGNGGTAVRVTACGLAWRAQEVTGKRSKPCGGWPRGWPRDHCPRQDTFCRHRKRRRRR